MEVEQNEIIPKYSIISVGKNIRYGFTDISIKSKEVYYIIISIKIYINEYNKYVLLIDI